MLVDADALAREVVEPGTPGLASVVEAFGQDMLGADGGLDRARLGALVFGNPDRLAVLNSIVHPLVRERAAAMIGTAPAAPSSCRTYPCWWKRARAAISIWCWWWMPRTRCGFSAWWNTGT